MKERPILFTNEMVRAIMEGKKTQTRRIVKCIPDLGEPDEWCGRLDLVREFCGGYERYCPYGKPGNLLWVKENWQTARCFDDLNATQMKEQAHDAGYSSPPYGPLWYPSNGQYVRWSGNDKKPVEHYGLGGEGRIRTSRFMPRWASRITLEIKNVRIERLQDITENDAKAEGCKPGWRGLDNPYKSGFSYLWDSINIKRKCDWYSNPWLWVIEFEMK